MNKSINLFIVSISLIVGSCIEGDEGKKSLIDLIDEPPGLNCAAGGYRVETGIDRNDNNVLEANEIQATKYVCNGNNGLPGPSPLVETLTELPGENCSAGGYKITFGIDLNENGIMDQNEIQDTRFVCHGISPGVYKEVRISFPGQGYQYSSTNVNGSTNSWTYLYDFKIDNYTGADSVVFASLLRSAATTSRGIAELYDITNNKVIPNSQISTTASAWTWVRSESNLIQHFPIGSFTLGVKVRPEVNGVEAAYFMPVLIIYRK